MLEAGYGESYKNLQPTLVDNSPICIPLTNGRLTVRWLLAVDINFTFNASMGLGSLPIPMLVGMGLICKGCDGTVQQNSILFF